MGQEDQNLSKVFALISIKTLAVFQSRISNQNAFSYGFWYVYRPKEVPVFSPLSIFGLLEEMAIFQA
jgi:hypothetical protein